MLIVTEEKISDAVHNGFESFINGLKAAPFHFVEQILLKNLTVWRTGQSVQNHQRSRKHLQNVR